MESGMSIPNMFVDWGSKNACRVHNLPLLLVSRLKEILIKHIEVEAGICCTFVKTK